MYWILLIVFPASTFSIVTEDMETCEAIQKINHMYWHEAGIKPQSLCMRTFQI